jgi:outer membrane protein OmpA-like peptidoglycan-associated protein
MEQARSRVREVMRATTDVRLDVCIAIVGYTDPIGTEAENRQLSARRAQHVAEALTAQGIRAQALNAAGAGVHPRAPTPARARTVAFEVTVGKTCTGAP